MLIQDALTGRLHEIPDHFHGSYLGEYGQLYEPQWGEYPQGYGYSPQYGAGQVVYDGLGNPVGILPLVTALAPLAAKVLPKLAQKVLPFAQKVLPKLAQRFFPGAVQRFLPVINQAAPAIANLFREPTPVLGQAPAPMMDPQGAPTPGAPLPASMPPSINSPATRVMGPMAHPMMRRRRRCRCRCVNVIRRQIAVPPPPAVREPIRGPGNAEPAGPVQGWGYYDGLGNPVGIGWNPFSVVRKVVNAVRGVASNIPSVGRLVNRLIPGTSTPPQTLYPYLPTQPYPAPQVPLNIPSGDMVNSMSPEGFPYPTTPSASLPYGWTRPYGPWSGWRRRPYGRGYGRYRHWTRSWRRPYR